MRPSLEDLSEEELTYLVTEIRAEVIRRNIRIDEGVQSVMSTQLADWKNSLLVAQASEVENLERLGITSLEKADEIRALKKALDFSRASDSITKELSTSEPNPSVPSTP